MEPPPGFSTIFYHVLHTVRKGVQRGTKEPIELSRYHTPYSSHHISKARAIETAAEPHRNLLGLAIKDTRYWREKFATYLLVITQHFCTGIDVICFNTFNLFQFVNVFANILLQKIAESFPVLLPCKRYLEPVSVTIAAIDRLGSAGVVVVVAVRHKVRQSYISRMA